jgi:hypothetical protein
MLNYKNKRSGGVHPRLVGHCGLILRGERQALSHTHKFSRFDFGPLIFEFLLSITIVPPGIFVEISWYTQQ